MSAPFIRVLVVDDSPFMRGVLPTKIEADPRFKVVGIAANGREAVDKTLALTKALEPRVAACQAFSRDTCAIVLDRLRRARSLLSQEELNVGESRRALLAKRELSDLTGLVAA